MFSIEWLTQIFPEYKTSDNRALKKIEAVSTDSRELANNSLFIPLLGDNFDGHDYVETAIKNGATALIWDEKKPLGDIANNVSVFFVTDTLKALQLLAKAYRELVNPKVIGITGSNGKTTTKDLLEATLNETFITTATKGNFNNHIGLPLTILNMKNKTEILILEMGMSDFGEIELLSEIATPDIAIITNIGESHIEHLGSRQGICQAKLEIVKSMSEEGLLIIDGDETLLSEASFKGEIITCGFSNSNKYLISDVKLTENTTQFLVNDKQYSIPLLGKHHAKNAAFVIALTEKLNLNHKIIQKGLNQTKITGMRFELLKGRNDITIINDAYNASPTSMKAGIEVIDELEGYQEKILVLGDILELGPDYEKYYQEISKEIIQTNIKIVYTYGEASKLITKDLKVDSGFKAEHFNDKDDLIKVLEKYLTKDNLIFFKASRGIKLEDIIEQLK